MSSTNKVHLFEDVAKHNRKGDCWLIVHGKVYDVTAFLDDHPGGDEVILNATGQDATTEFEDVGHSDDARDSMKQYYIGEVDKNSLPTKAAVASSTSTSSAGDQNSGGFIKILQFLLPLLILGIAFAYRQFSKKEE